MSTTERPDDEALNKADFDDVYVQPDPRPYFRELGALGYEIPKHGEAMFSRVIDALPSSRPRIADLCCSYGVVGALLNHDVTLDQLYDRYGSEEIAQLSTGELLSEDRDYYERLRRDDTATVIGVDASEPAINYACEAGLLDAGVAEDLESSVPSPQAAETLAGTDLVTVTGGVGYITEQTVGHVIDAAGAHNPPWVAALCLRTVDYDPVADSLAERDMVTERLPDRSFRQRSYADETEREYAFRELAALDRDPTAEEHDGYYADFYLSRPKDAAAGAPLEQVIT